MQPLLLLALAVCTLANHISIHTGLGPAGLYTRQYEGSDTPLSTFTPSITKQCKPGYVLSDSDSLCHPCVPGTWYSTEESGCTSLGSDVVCPVSTFLKCDGTALAETAWTPVRNANGQWTGYCQPPQPPAGYSIPSDSCALQSVYVQGVSTTDLVSWGRQCTENMTVTGSDTTLQFATADARCPTSKVEICGTTHTVEWEEVQWTKKGSCPSGWYEPFPGGTCVQCNAQNDCENGPVCQPSSSSKYSKLAQGKCSSPSSFPPSLNKASWAAGCADLGQQRNMSVRIWWPCAANSNSGQCVSITDHHFQPWYGGIERFACANPSADRTECQCPSSAPVFRFTSTYNAQTNNWEPPGCTSASGCGPNQWPAPLPHTNSSVCAWCNYYDKLNISDPSLKYWAPAGSSTCQTMPPSECFYWMNTGVQGEGHNDNPTEGFECCKRDQAFLPTPGVVDQRECRYCKIGEFAPPQSSRCYECKPGTINVWNFNATCDTPLPANATLRQREYHGVFTPDFKYSCLYLSDTCKPCGTGKIANSNRTACLECPRGTYQPLEASDTCIPCPAGSYSEKGWRECQACPLFTAFNADLNECRPVGCAQNQVTLANGTCSNCTDNHFMPFPLQHIKQAKSCWPCARNYYRTGSMAVCEPCPAGSAGKNDGPGCVLCKGREWSGEVGSAQCTLCTENYAIGETATSGNTQCTDVDVDFVRGPQGCAGPQGLTGPVGVTGPVGPAGPTGPQGIKGLPNLVQGPTGKPGAVGPQGEDSKTIDGRHVVTTTSGT